MPTWTDVANNISFAGPGGFTPPPGVGVLPSNQDILDALEELYIKSSAVRAMLDGIVGGPSLYIGLTAAPVGGSIGSHPFLGLNPTQTTTQSFYFNDTGTLIADDLRLTIAHELVHALQGLPDPLGGSATEAQMNADPAFDYDGPAVALQNQAAIDLGISSQQQNNYYTGILNTSGEYGLLSQGISYSEGAAVDIVRFSRESGAALIDTSQRPDGSEDVLIGFSSADELYSGNGADYLYGGAGDDTLVGGGDNDLLFGGDFRTAAGSDGTDKVDYSKLTSAAAATAGIILNADFTSTEQYSGQRVIRVTNDGTGGTDRLVSIERITATDFKDTFKFAGEFTAGLDFRIDAKSSASQTDTIDLSTSTTGFNLNITAGNSGVLQAASGGGTFTINNFQGAVLGSASADHVETAGAAIHIRGGGGADELIGGAGDDILVGGDDSTGDSLTGGAGSDVFVAGNGDVITDGTAQDRLAISETDFINGEATRDEGSSGPYTNAAGHTFEMDGDDLVVVANGATIRVEDFDDGDLGITLREKDEDDEDEPGDDDGPGPVSGPFAFPIGPFLNPPASPLVLDLDGDGLEITALAGSRVHFDLDASGSRETTGWLAGDDGFLVFDANANGSIDNGQELFGNNADNGFNVLAFYDGRTGGNYYSNSTGGTIDSLTQDGTIDASDAIWSSLQIWRDLDQDGVSETGELFSLESLGIQAINLNYAFVNVPVHEHEIRQTSTATTSSGSIEISDVWFLTDRTNTVHDHDPNALGFEGWPDLHAIGSIRSLRHAMSLDSELADAVQSFLEDAEVLSLDSLQARFTEVLLTWAGVEDNPLTGRGEYFPDARILQFLELAHDREYLQLAGINAGLPDPGPGATSMMLQAFGAARDTLMLQVLSQVPEFRFARAMAQNEAYQVSRFDFLSPALSYDVATGQHTFDAVQFLRALDQLDPSDPVSIQGVTAILDYLPSLGAMLGWPPEAFLAEMHAAAFEAGRPDLRMLIDWYLAQPEDGGRLSRGVVRAASEDQTIAGSGLSDVIVVDEGLGTITFERDASADRIALTSAFNGASWTVEFDPPTGDLTIHFGTQGVTLVLEGYFAGTIYDVAYRADVVYFADGAVLDLETLRVAATGEATSGDDVRFGTGFDDDLQGLDGADTMHGGDGQDLLDGGAGDDILIGGRGSDVIIGGTGADQLGGPGGSDSSAADTYILRAGDGHDTLYETSGGNIVDLTDTDLTDVLMAWSGADLILTFVGRPNDSLTLVNFRSVETISTFLFASAVEQTYRQIVDEAFLQEASPGNDTLTGTSGHDTLVGGLGDDEIFGASSSFTSGDVFLYRQGDGDDIVHASYLYTEDQLVLRGIEPDDVTVTRSGNDAVLSFAGGGSVTLHDQFQSLGWNVLERVVFDDGTIWTERDIAFSVLAPQTTPTITGTSGAETLNGTSGRDVFDGAAGDDLLKGGSGSDTYLFGAGSGHDVILDQGGDDAFEIDVVRIDALPGDVVVSRVNDDVVLTLSTGDSLTLSQFFTYYGSGLNGSTAIERLIFSDGSHWDASQVARSAWVRGTSGVDTLEGRGGADTILGGTGNDILDGDSGDDVYVVRSGDGDDYIDEGNSGGDDVVLFEDANLSDVRIVLVTSESDPDQLRIERIDQTGSVTVERFGSIETVRFADGSTLDMDALALMAIIEGTEDIETVYGTWKDDQIFGLEGADTLRGDSGFDTYHWSRGDGDDVIMDFGNDSDLGQLRLHGIDPSLVGLSRVPTAYPANGALYDLMVTIQPLNEGDVVETITLARFFAGYGGDYEGVTDIIFDNGVVWSRTDLVQNSILNGTVLEETLIGTSLGETIDGGEGADVLEGRYGSDTYVWRTGDGDDQISDGGELWDADTLRLTDVSADGVSFARDGDDLLIHVLSTDEIITVTGQFWVYDPMSEGNPEYEEGVERVVFANGLELTAAQILALIPPPDPDPDPGEGTPDSDWIPGTGEADHLRGFAGDDSLEGYEGDDLLEGGLDNDWMSGGEGADTYIYYSGDGSDSIWDGGEGSEADHLNLADVDWGDVILSFDEFGLRIELLDGVISLDGMFANEMGYWHWANDATGVETFAFSDEILRTSRDLLNAALAAGGVTLDQGTTSADILIGGSGRDALAGAEGDDTLSGGGDADRLFGGLGEDTLTGGLGDDELVGGQGADTYVYAAGDGEDTIVDFDEDVGDVLQFGSGILQGDVSIARSGYDAILSLAGGGTLVLREQFGGYGVDAIDFDSGPDWTIADIYERYLEEAGTSGADNIIGSNGADILDGDAGDDELSGEEGSDTYLFASGSGADIVYDYDYTDTSFDEIVFAAGLDSTAVTVERDPGSPDDIILVFSTGESVRIAEAMYLDPAEAQGTGIEQITFGDSVVWTREDLYDAYFASAATGADDHIMGFSLYDDILSGGAGADTFAFGYEFGDDIVTDFSLTDDVIQLVDYTDFNDIMLNATQVGTDVVFNFGSAGTLTLVGIDLLDLTESHFGLEGPAMQIGLRSSKLEHDQPLVLPVTSKGDHGGLPWVLPGMDDDGFLLTTKGGDAPQVLPGAFDDGLTGPFNLLDRMNLLRPQGDDGIGALIAEGPRGQFVRTEWTPDVDPSLEPDPWA